MKVFITGGTGFLGKFLIEKLKFEKYQICSPTSKECNLLKRGDLNNYVESYDFIYHLAAWTQAGDFCLFHKGEQWLINQQINTNILDWWQSMQPQAKFISIGTSCSYDPNLSLEEKNYLLGKPIDSLYTYAMRKRMLQIGIESISSQYKLNYLTLVPSTLFGENYHLDGRQMHFIFDLIRKIFNGKFNGDKVILWGDGNQRRELVYVNDFVDIMFYLAQNYTNEIINIGSGNDYSIKQFAGMICHYINFNNDLIEYDTSRYVGASSKILSINKLNDLNIKYRLTNLDKSLKKTIDWYKNNVLK